MFASIENKREKRNLTNDRHKIQWDINQKYKLVGRSRDTYASYNYNERELALKVVLQIMRCYATVSYTDRTSIEGRSNSSLDATTRIVSKTI